MGLRGTGEAVYSYWRDHIFEWTNQKAGFNTVYVSRFRLLECLDSTN